MITDKIFYIHEAWFNLPDNFEGNYAEALMLLAEYYLEEEKEHKNIEINEDIDNFTILMESDNQKGVIECGFGKLDREKNEYVVREYLEK